MSCIYQTITRKTTGRSAISLTGRERLYAKGRFSAGSLMKAPSGGTFSYTEEG